MAKYAELVKRMDMVEVSAIGNDDCGLSAEQVMLARSDFWEFRKLIHPKLKDGWWQREIAKEFQLFAKRLAAGERPKLVVQAPPQHGKSMQVVDLIAWIAGRNPDLKTIYTSFSERLGVRANLQLQRLYTTPIYQRVFPRTKIGKSRAIADGATATRNRELLEYSGKDGFFRNTTVSGSITGESLDLGVIDDPIKGRQDANSKTIRDKAWDWFTDDFFTRFSEEAGLLCILTRWHIDDPIGRLLKRYKGVRLLSYPAIAERDEKHRKEGEALFPEHKSLEFLKERKDVMDSHSWLSLYQQSPVQKGGEIIKGAWFGRYKALPDMKWRACFGDTALKAKQSSDYQVAECWGLGIDGNLYLIDLMREKFEAYELERRFPDFWTKQKASTNGRLRYFGIEDKASGTDLIQRMQKTIKPRIPVKAIPRSIDKYTRVMDILGYIESGHVMIPESAPWVRDFLTECESFTADNAHENDDQIDPMCDAISMMLHNSKPLLSDIL